MAYSATGDEVYSDIRSFWINEGLQGPIDDARVEHVSGFLVEKWMKPPKTFGLEERQAGYIAKTALESAREALDRR